MHSVSHSFPWKGVTPGHLPEQWVMVIAMWTIFLSPINALFKGGRNKKGGGGTRHISHFKVFASSLKRVWNHPLAPWGHSCLTEFQVHKSPLQKRHKAVSSPMGWTPFSAIKTSDEPRQFSPKHLNLYPYNIRSDCSPAPAPKGGPWRCCNSCRRAKGVS